MEREYEAACEAAEFIKSRCGFQPKAGIVLGSGLGELCDQIENPVILDYRDIPDMPETLAPGHVGKLYAGMLSGCPVMAFRGRFHCYEGYTPAQVAFPIRVMKLMGAKILVSTNASGGLNPEYYKGAMVAITDHINLTGMNPLTGVNDERFGERFPDMLNVYDADLIKLMHQAAEETQTELFDGVFAALSGPNFETKAEMKMLRLIGGDIIGWSTVFEILAARHMGMRSAGFTLITDMSVPETLENVDADKVLAAARDAVPKFVRLMKHYFEKVGKI